MNGHSGVSFNQGIVRGIEMTTRRDATSIDLPPRADHPVFAPGEFESPLLQQVLQNKSGRSDGE